MQRLQLGAMKYEKDLCPYLKLWAICIIGSSKCFQIYFVGYCKKEIRILHCYDCTLNVNILQDLQTMLNTQNNYVKHFKITQFVEFSLLYVTYSFLTRPEGRGMELAYYTINYDGIYSYSRG